MNKLKLAVLAFAVLAVTAIFVPNDMVSADAKTQIRTGASQTGAGDGVTLESRIGTVTSVMFYIIGAIAVIMIIFGGIKYVTSAGDASKIKSAKDTILYSVVGLVIALLAYAIVNFVINHV